ncbi:MAG: T9SS type A sorting domain-containing protein, partial [Cyclobacteriaceae bacterium]|nr:T9SS type A sorting domain-containing protein [Cyclobacteriaceae bacterium]
VYINNGIPINPPAFKAATFDGLNALGRLYSLDPESDGITDQLISNPIDLSGLTDLDNVYISFFYQIKGNGELPNQNDSLRLYFYDVNNLWVKVWSISGSSVQPDTFLLHNRKISEPDFLHPGFKFKLETTGRQSGSYDTWNVDYIYLNKNITDFNFPDRALSTGPLSVFKEYTSIPIQHFNENPLSCLDYSGGTAMNLFNELQPSNFTLTASIHSLQSDLSWVVEKDTLAFELPSSFPNPTTTGIRKINLTGDNLINPAKISSDSLVKIKLKLFMNTDDNQPPDYQNLYLPLDFTINDTIYHTQTLGNYYGYDDGTAEYGAGLNYSGDMVAYEFKMKSTTQDTLVAVDMYFPNIGEPSAGKIIAFTIWRNLKEEPGSILHQETFTIQASDSINKFVHYPLSKPIVVQDSFFIGWRQTAAVNVDIGFDKNTDSGNKIYFNLDGTWKQNLSLKGSLMMHPVFGKANIILGRTVKEEMDVIVYPNPAKSILTLEGVFDAISMTDILGKTIISQYNTDRLTKMDIDVSMLPRGIYIIQFIRGRQVGYHKIKLE